MENLTNEEKDYYELLIDLLENGEISDSERNILNKRKEKYSISDSRANEIEEFAREERLKNLKHQNDSESSYYELILDFMENGSVSENNRKILTKRMEKYGITEARAKELEDFARQEYLESKKVKFESEEEKEYYEFIVDLMENGDISENNRKILDKRKIKFGISEARAKELEEFAKSNNSSSSNDLLEEGKTYYNNGEYDKAIEIFKKTVELNPNEWLNWNWLGRSYYERCNDGDEENAINSLLKAVELNPNGDSNWYWLGNSYRFNGQYDKAIESLLKAVEINPSNADSWHELGRLYHDSKQYDKAIEPLLKAIELDPDKAIDCDYPNYVSLLVSSYNLNNQPDKALNLLQKTVELNPNNADNWYYLARSYIRNGQYDKAIESSLKAIEIDPNSRYYWFVLGRSYYDNEQYKEAIDSLSKAVELNPNNDKSWRDLGYSYGENEQYDKSVNALEQAIEINPNDNNTWLFYSISLAQLKRIEEAKIACNKALEINPNNAGIEIMKMLNSGGSISSNISSGIKTLGKIVESEEFGTVVNILKKFL